MAVLSPSPPAFTLDTLIARARAVRTARTPSRPTEPKPLPRHKTLADLERASSLTARDPSAPLYAGPPVATPVALALWITIRRCACGSVTRCPPDYILTKYAANEHSFHYTRSGLERLPADLPREVREKEVAIPFCEKCFDAN